MKVLIVGLATFDQMAGGSARYLTGVSEELRRMGHQVDIRTAAEHVPTVGYSERGFLGQLKRFMTRLFITVPPTMWAVLSKSPDVVNTHFALDGLPAVIAARMRRIPVVVNFQGPWAIEAVATGRRGRWPLSTRLRLAVERVVYKQADRCIVLSRAFGDLLHHTYGVKEDRIRIIPAGIDWHRFATAPSRAEARRLLQVPDSYTLVTVRRLVPRMGVEIAIDALLRLNSKRDAVLLIAGSGPERARLEARALELGIGDRIRLLGRVPDDLLPLVYAAADVCVVPSRELEGFGYVALEALAAGTPVVATGTGGLRELIGGLEPRWVVDADADAIASVIESIRTRPEIYPNAAACKAYAATMDWSRIAPRVLDVFSEAIEEHRTHLHIRH